MFTLVDTSEFILETLAHFVRSTDAPPPGIPAHVGPDFERELMWLCEWHGLTPIIIMSLEQLALRPKISRITYERMKALYQASSSLNKELISTAQRLAAEFASRGIESKTMQDVAFATALYPDSALRPIDKLDLLVKEENWLDVIEACGAVGFHRGDREPQFRTGADALVFYQSVLPCVLENEKGDRVCLKFRLFDVGDPVRPEVAWERGSGDRLAHEDELIQSGIACATARFDRLLHAVDIGLLLDRFGPDLDWVYIESRLRSRGMYPVVYLTLSRVARWFKLDVLPARMERPGNLRRRLFDLYWGRRSVLPTRGRPDPPHRFRFYLLESGDFGDKLRILLRVLRPEGEWVSAFFGCPARPWHKLKYAFLVLRNRVAASPGWGQR